MTKQQISDVLRSHGVCPTQQRVAVYEYLLNHRTHPTADTIYHALVQESPTFSRTTVYNSAKALAAAGLIRVITIDAEEQRFDAGVENHGHFRCTHCNEVFDFPVSEESVTALSPASFEGNTWDVYVTGVCPHCQASL